MGEHIQYVDVEWPRHRNHGTKPWLSADYLTYIDSVEWKTFRRKALDAAKYRCQWAKCGAGNHLHVHHITYERLGRERLSDVTVLCELHHKMEHWRLEDEIRFSSWARKVYGDEFYDSYDFDEDVARDRFNAWLERQAY